MQTLTEHEDIIVINRKFDKVSPLITVIVQPEFIEEFQEMCKRHLLTQKCSKTLAGAIEIIASDKLANV